MHLRGFSVREWIGQLVTYLRILLRCGDFCYYVCVVRIFLFSLCFVLLIFIGRFLCTGYGSWSFIISKPSLVYQGFENRGRPYSNVPNNNYSIDWFGHKTYKATSGVSKIAHNDEKLLIDSNFIDNLKILNLLSYYSLFLNIF